MKKKIIVCILSALLLGVTFNACTGGGGGGGGTYSIVNQYR